MNEHVLGLFILVQEIIVEVEAMKAENQLRYYLREYPAYTENDFFCKVTALEKIRSRI